MTRRPPGGGTAADTLFHDFELAAGGRRVLCARGARNPAGGHTADSRWGYLFRAGTPPVRLLRARPGETPREVWECALRRLGTLA